MTMVNNENLKDGNRDLVITNQAQIEEIIELKEKIDLLEQNNVLLVTHRENAEKEIENEQATIQ